MKYMCAVTGGGPRRGKEERDYVVVSKRASARERTTLPMEGYLGAIARKRITWDIEMLGALVVIVVEWNAVNVLALPIRHDVEKIRR